MSTQPDPQLDTPNADSDFAERIEEIERVLERVLMLMMQLSERIHALEKQADDGR